MAAQAGVARSTEGYSWMPVPILLVDLSIVFGCLKFMWDVRSKKDDLN